MSNRPEITDAPIAPPQATATTGTRSLEKTDSKKAGESWVETIKTIVYALLIAFVIRTFLFQPFNIPSGSMENTLLIGDYLFVEKFAYGYSRYSLPLGEYLPSFGHILFHAPKRGDVVVFKMPNEHSSDYMKD